MLLDKRIKLFVLPGPDNDTKTAKKARMMTYRIKYNSDVDIISDNLVPEEFKMKLLSRN